MNTFKLLFIIPTMKAGGAERVLLNLLSQLDKSTWDVHLLLGSIRGEFVDKIPDHVKVFRIFPNYIFLRISNFIYRLFGVTMLLRIFLSRFNLQYETGVSFLDGPLTEVLNINCSLEFKRRITVVHSSYRSFDNMRRSITHGHFKRMLNRYKNLDTIVTVSNDAKTEFESIFGQFNDLRVIYNPINSADIHTKSSIFQVKRNSNVVTFTAIGSLVPVKGFDRLIDAAKGLRKLGYDFQIEIIGDGHLKKKLEIQISDYGLSDHIELKGFLSNPYPYLISTNVLIMPSFSEGLPTVLCEAMILGKAVLVPNVSGCREIVDNGKFGLMVDNNVGGLTHGMKSYIDNPNLIEEFSLKSKKRGLVFDDSKAIAEYSRLFFL